MYVRMLPDMGHVIFDAEVVRVSDSGRSYYCKVISCEERPGIVGHHVSIEKNKFIEIYDK